MKIIKLELCLDGTIRNVLTLLFLAVIIIQNASALPIESQKMFLLAVSEGRANESFGSTATVSLQLIPSGSGEIFINTFPFARTDTQVSMRLAKEVACDLLNNIDEGKIAGADCNSYDYLYTIETGSSTISGPSAGAAIAILTASSLLGDLVNDDVTISGTINSGGLIGAVGGLKEKIDAAATRGIKTVLIPLGERFTINNSLKLELNSTNISTQIEGDGNSTIAYVNISENSTYVEKMDSKLDRIDLIDYGKSIGVNVIEVGTLRDAIVHISGRVIPQVDTQIIVPEYYTNNMKDVANRLCSRAQNMLDNLSANIDFGEVRLFVNNESNFSNNESTILPRSNIDVNMSLNSARQLLNKSKGAMLESAFYSAASYCYGAALNLRFISLLELTPQEAHDKAQEAVEQNEINLSNYQTLTDLQTYMLVDERITEANERIISGDKLAAENLTALAINSYATAIERSYSAKLWSSFFSTESEHIDLDSEAITESCKLKIQEATERQNLLAIYTNDDRAGYELLEEAQKQLGKSPVLCLFAASKAKASYDVVLSSVGISPDVFNETFNTKVKIAAQVIDSQFKKGVFPLIGYSYYEYAQNLALTDQSSAILYIQFALELSNLDAYLSSSSAAKSKTSAKKFAFVAGKQIGNFEMLVIGLCFGILMGVTLLKVEQRIIRNRLNSTLYSKHNSSGSKKRK